MERSTERHTEMIDDNLTKREQMVLYLVAEQYTNKEIGHRLSIEVITVKKHVQNICLKLGANNRREAARLAREQGLLPPQRWIDRAVGLPAANSLAHAQIHTASMLDVRVRLHIDQGSTVAVFDPTDPTRTMDVPVELVQWSALTPRQQQIALMLLDKRYVNASARMLGQALSIAETTVKKHLQRIYRDLSRCWCKRPRRSD